MIVLIFFNMKYPSKYLKITQQVVSERVVQKYDLPCRPLRFAGELYIHIYIDMYILSLANSSNLVRSYNDCYSLITIDHVLSRKKRFYCPLPVRNTIFMSLFPFRKRSVENTRPIECFLILIYENAIEKKSGGTNQRYYPPGENGKNGVWKIHAPFHWYII